MSDKPKLSVTDTKISAFAMYKLATKKEQNKQYYSKRKDYFREYSKNTI